MTIEELYEWAKENNVLDCDLVIRDSCGSYTHWIEPEIVSHGTYIEVEL